MIVLDEPYVSDPLVDWLEQSQHPVLDNAVAAALAAEGLPPHRSGRARVHELRERAGVGR